MSSFIADNGEIGGGSFSVLPLTCYHGIWKLLSFLFKTGESQELRCIHDDEMETTILNWLKLSDLNVS